jgi:hypothetical protein
MKTKKIDKKLSLNKKTIVHLNNTEMDDIQGRGFEEKKPVCSALCPSTSESPDCSHQVAVLT